MSQSSTSQDAKEPANRTIARVAYETMQFFEIDLPKGEDPETYCDTAEARAHFAGLVISGFIDFKLERRFDANGAEL